MATNARCLLTLGDDVSHAGHGKALSSRKVRNDHAGLHDHARASVPGRPREKTVVISDANQPLRTMTATASGITTAPAHRRTLQSGFRIHPGGHSRRLARRGLAAALLWLPVALIQPQRASAQSTRFALACIGTETGYTVNFSYRWGSTGTWKSSSVAPGKWVKLMWNYEYPGENRSPQLTVRYDDNTTTASNIVRTDLKAYAASDSNCENQGKTYNFYERGTELYIQEED